MAKKKWVKALLGVVGVLIVILVVMFSYLTNGLKAGMQVTVGELDFSQLADGVYLGEYKAGRWTNQVQVTVEQQQVTDIQIVKDVSFARPDLTEQLIDDILAKQSLQVDAITGATVTINAYLKAIENALAQ
jgi:uncharacterized protein with FMN-binding domain